LAARLRFDDLAVRSDAAVTRMGIAWLPYWLARERIQSGALVPLWENRPMALVDSPAIWPASDYMSLCVHLEIYTLVEKLPKAMGAQVPSVRLGWHAQSVVASGTPSPQGKRRAR
jgi:DNA-binding transcriptional LysR family regulator